MFLPRTRTDETKITRSVDSIPTPRNKKDLIKKAVDSVSIDGKSTNSGRNTPPPNAVASLKGPSPPRSSYLCPASPPPVTTIERSRTSSTCPAHFRRFHDLSDHREKSGVGWGINADAESLRFGVTPRGIPPPESSPATQCQDSSTIRYRVLRTPWCPSMRTKPSRIG